MRTAFRSAGVVAGILTLAACEQTLLPEDGSLTRAETESVTLQLDAIASGFVASAGMLGERSFSRSRECPGGGTVTVAGSVTTERDRATRTETVQMNSTETHAGCVVERGAGISVTIDGRPNIALAATRKLVDGKPSGLQTATQKGEFAFVTSNGRSGTCEIDIVSTFDPAAGTVTVKGTNCGRTIDVTRRRGG